LQIADRRFQIEKSEFQNLTFGIGENQPLALNTVLGL
jgi:hypothetical protein